MTNKLIFTYTTAFLIAACTQNQEGPKFSFTVENCQKLENNPKHPYHSKDLFVLGCEQVYEDARWEALQESEKKSKTDNSL